MTYILSEKQYGEFQGISQLIRAFSDPESDDSLPFLFVKTGAIVSRFIFHKKDFELIIGRFRDNPYLLYALKINDDEENPALLWSIAESQNELEALSKIVETQQFKMCVFNELAINTFSGTVSVSINNEKANHILFEITGVPLSQELIHEIGNQFFDDYAQKKINENYIEIMGAKKNILWKETYLHYLPTRSPHTASVLSISEEEGNQQEELILWLTDNLSLEGVIKSPQVTEGQEKRELCDILFGYENCCFVFESKSLSILKHDEIPNRKKLTAKTLKSVDKALKQLVGASKNIRNGSKITDKDGVDIEIPRDKVNHSIILIPDLSLLSEATVLGKETIKSFYKKTGSMLHILDTEELYRMVHASLILADKGVKTTPVMAFDAMLTERIHWALNVDTPMFRFLLKIVESQK